MFPVGEYRKEEIRRIAEQLGLRVAAKRDSQEICFVPDQDHARFIRQQRGPIDTSGEIVTTDGTVVGRHDGFERFTIGQRKGLRVAFGEPRYVVRVEPATYRVVIGTHDELAQRELYAAGANWLVEERGEGREERGEGRGETGEAEGGGLGTSVSGEVGSRQSAVGSKVHSNPQSPIPNPCSASSLSSFPSFRAQVKIRYRSQPAEARVELLPNRRFHVCFDEPCYAIAPGQAAVCYDGDRVLGGGWIE